MSTVDGMPQRCNGHRDLAALCHRSIQIRSSRSLYARWKGTLDRAMGTLLLVPGVPMIGLLAAMVRCTSPGPAIFRQVRVGKDGKTFMMYKIRTMRVDAERGTGAVWTKPGDPRITPVGSFLRKWHLDELPQLFNVVKGDMALVGPRPERPEFVCVLAEQIPGYLDRLAVPPGITGLAQINLPPDTDVESVRRKLSLDLEYIRTIGFWLDLRVLACTAARFVGFRGDWAARLLGLRRAVALDTHPAGSASISGASHPNAAAPTPDSIAAPLAGRREPENGGSQPHAADVPKRSDSSSPLTVDKPLGNSGLPATRNAIAPEDSGGVSAADSEANTQTSPRKRRGVRGRIRKPR